MDDAAILLMIECSLRSNLHRYKILFSIATAQNLTECCCAIKNSNCFGSCKKSRHFSAFRIHHLECSIGSCGCIPMAKSAAFFYEHLRNFFLNGIFISVAVDYRFIFVHKFNRFKTDHIRRISLWRKTNKQTNQSQTSNMC